jgi:hypothetical protein
VVRLPCHSGAAPRALTGTMSMIPKVGYRFSEKIMLQQKLHHARLAPGMTNVAKPRPHAAVFTSVSSDTNSLPRVSGLNRSVTTKTKAAPIVAISMGTAKPSG